MRGIPALLLVALLAPPAPAASPKGAQPRAPRSLIPVPPVRQATEYTCGPASLLSVLAYFGKGAVSERALARQAKTNWRWGTDERDLARVATRLGLRVTMRYEMSLAELKARVRRGRPVIVGFQAWPDNPRTFRRSGDDSGHFAVVIGFDRERIWFQDPYAPVGTRAYLSIPDFLQRWHWPDSRGRPRRHFGMTLTSPTRTRVRGSVEGVAEVE